MRDRIIWPEIDIIIPTLNCRENLEKCLRAIRDQDYQGRLKVYVVDGGSTDGTIEIANKYGCETIIVEGSYSSGMNGAKMIGEKRGSGEFIWHVDSDNFLVGPNVARKLIEPLMRDPGCNISIPFNLEGIIYNKDTSKAAKYYNEFINWFELNNLRDTLGTSVKTNDYYTVKELTYGISNATIIRREAEATVGYYDSDVELLKRLRKRGLASAALVPYAKFQQSFTSSLVGTAKKTLRRAKFFSNFGKEQRDTFFVEGRQTFENHFNFSISSLINIYLEYVRKFVKEGDKRNLLFLFDILFKFLVLVFSLRYLLKLYFRR